MAIFGSTKQVTENVEELDVIIDESTITPTMECSDQILMEFADDMYKIQAGLYVADILIEEKICTEGYSEEIEALAEGTVKETVSRVVENFKKLWAKIKAWFKSVIENFKIRITSQKNFLSKYEKAIKDKISDAKSMKGFSYNDYEYYPEKLEAACVKARDVIYKEISGGIANLSVEQLLNPNTDGGSVKPIMMKSEDYTKDVCNKIKSSCNNNSDVKKFIVDEARSGKQNIIEFMDIDVNKMIAFCKGDDVKRVEKIAAEMDKQLGSIVNTFKKAESKADKENVGAITTFSAVASNAQKLVTLSQNITSVQTSMLNTICKNYISVLKRVLTYKGKKEAAKENTTSLLESAMSLIG